MMVYIYEIDHREATRTRNQNRQAHRAAGVKIV